MSADEVWSKVPELKFYKSTKGVKRTKKEVKEYKNLMFPILFGNKEYSYAEVISPDGKYVVTRNIHEGKEGKFISYNIYTEKTFNISKWQNKKVKNLQEEKMEEIKREDVTTEYVEITVHTLEALIRSINEDNEKGLYKPSEALMSQHIKSAVILTIDFLKTVHRVHEVNNLGKE
jgi:hypothetical protein